MFVAWLLSCLLTATFAAPQFRTFDRHSTFQPRNPHNTLSHQQHNTRNTFDRQRYDYERRPFIPIVSYNQYGPVNGEYSFDYVTGNGIRRNERGTPTAPNNAVEKQGAWSFTFPDGTPADFTFVADENGYRPQSSLIPVGPPLPPHAVEQIRKAERERAQGIFHDGQYDPNRYQRQGSYDRRYY